MIAGESLGPYELLAKLGEGGMGEVWEALDPGLGRRVAIKILPSQYSRDPDRLRRFEQEARAVGMLNHPNVLAIYAIGKQDPSTGSGQAIHYLVTELLEGATLRRRLASGALPETTAIEYSEQIVQGLAAAHEKGIVHRDLKPENVFITVDGRVKILDFGLAKLTQTDPAPDAQTQTASGIALGTPAYMSPEQVRGQSADQRSDIFAVGVVLYEMLSGRRAFRGETSVEAMNAILKEQPLPITEASPELQQIVLHCLEKAPGDRYQSARDLGFQLRLAHRPSVQTARPLTIRPPRYLALATAALALLAIGAGVTWWLTRGTPTVPAPTLTRLTFDSGLTTDPALSPDGKLVAYASDRAGEGNLDIWRQQLATGEAVPLTTDSADESEPAFSPDGSRIAFRSEREGGGIYVVSAFGGDPRLIAKQGRRPRFSPDGREIAYWVAVGPWYIGKVFVVPAVGGTPRPIEPTFATALYPVWSPDGKKLLFLGARDPKDLSREAGEWWIVPQNGDRAVKTGVGDVFERQRIVMQRGSVMMAVAPSDWVGDHVFFSGTSDASTNLWRISIQAATGKAEGPAQRITSGTSVDAEPSIISGDRIAFASLKQDLNIWSLPIAGNSGRVVGDLQQVTGAAFDAHTSISADGQKLVFISTRFGTSDVWMKDLVSGRETALTATPLHKEQPEITADGTRVCYMANENSQWVLYEMATSGGVPQKLCDGCGRPWDWSPDGTKLLYLIGEGERQPGISLGVIDTTTREKTVFLEHPDYQALARARFSPDGRWVALGAINRTGVFRIVIVPFQAGGGPPEDQWITIVRETTAALDKPRWSPDGNLLYYLSEADGFRCIRAQRLDPATKRPVGQAFDVYHSHSARRSLMNAWFGSLEISVSADRLFFNLGETTGNLWLAEWKP